MNRAKTRMVTGQTGQFPYEVAKELTCQIRGLATVETGEEEEREMKGIWRFLAPFRRHEYE